MVREPESEESRRSLVTLSRAVSVLWWVRKPDWNVSYRLLERRYCLSSVATALSNSFERNVRYILWYIMFIIIVWFDFSSQVSNNLLEIIEYQYNCSNK